MENKIRVKWAKGKTRKIVSARVLPGTDLISGIEKICFENKIESGAFSVIGSLEKSTFVLPVIKKGTKKGVSYGEPQTVLGPLEILSGKGFISQDRESKNGLFIHFHAIFSDAKGKVYGGHFLPGGNPVLLTLDVIIMEFDEVSLSREEDTEIGIRVITPSEKAR
ncbi:MAG: DNA-binding protein [Syntrophaceae bacterium]|nr:DNA-binding protein [Syntrophaceae bacterium]